MPEVGHLGRMPPGESWRRAMQEVARRQQIDGSRKRYLVRGRRIEANWYAYEIRPSAYRLPPPAPPLPMTQARLDELSSNAPRCAQRSRANHGGNSKVAWRDEKTAGQVAAFLGARAYRCPLVAPTIGAHWHISTSKKRGKANR